jgi:exosortase/archaeosortase
VALRDPLPVAETPITSANEIAAVTPRRIGAGIWFLFSFVLGAAGLNELLEGDFAGAVFGAALSPACGWVGYRVLKNLSRDIAVVAACLAAFLALFSVVSLVQGNLSPFPPGVIVFGLVGAAGIIPMRERPPR